MDEHESSGVRRFVSIDLYNTCFMYLFYFYKQCQLMKCCCWHKQWFEMAHVPWAYTHLSVCLPACRSVCTSKTCIRCNKLVQVSSGCTQGQQNILWLYSPASPAPPRLQTTSVTFLTKLSEAESPSLFWWPWAWSTLMPTSQGFKRKGWYYFMSFTAQ